MKCENYIPNPFNYFLNLERKRNYKCDNLAEWILEGGLRVCDYCAIYSFPLLHKKELNNGQTN